MDLLPEMSKKDFKDLGVEAFGDVLRLFKVYNLYNYVILYLISKLKWSLIIMVLLDSA